MVIFECKILNNRIIYINYAIILTFIKKDGKIDIIIKEGKMAKKVVAIVGRPNVGKSTLFNVLAGEKISIIKDTPGVTRDRIYADCNWRGTNFQIIDTGGIEPESDNIIVKQMRRQAKLAMDIADVIVFITDVNSGEIGRASCRERV